MQTFFIICAMFLKDKQRVNTIHLTTSMPPAPLASYDERRIKIGESRVETMTQKINKPRRHQSCKTC
ncbi:hypothetical protein B0182_06135 [Moraxella bovis]|nr:hypothetical protein DQF64_03635 [Moraxella bovis]OOR90178.1 hypothetical protein B0182_06135 [Moraxella bovis]